MAMDVNVALLSDVYESAQMGLDAAEVILKQARDEEFRRDLAQQMDEYRRIQGQVLEEMRVRGFSDEPENPLASAGLIASVKLATLSPRHRTPQHLAGMIIEGSTMGMVEMARAQREHAQAEPEVAQLSQQLEIAEEDNIHRMKRHL